MFVLLIDEFTRRNEVLVVDPHRKNFNRWLAEAAAAYPNVRLVCVSDFIDEETEFLNDQRSHFDRKVYHRLYLHMMTEAKADLAEQRTGQGARAGR